MAQGKKNGLGILSWFRRGKRASIDESVAAAAGSKSAGSGDSQSASSAPKSDTPACPKCGAAMYQRFNLQTRRMQWGCIKYPSCKGTRSL